MLYPILSELWNSYASRSVSLTYDNKVNSLTKDKIDIEWDKAIEYNNTHDFLIKSDAFDKNNPKNKSDYTDVLNPLNNGVMGYIDIVKINKRLPIYHGTKESVLEKGAGHLEGTSLPIGGLGTHCVLAGHRGLPSAKLFTDIDKLKLKDRFHLHILNKILAYEVDQIKVVLPSDTKYLQIDEHKDYVTLITCTPYGVNTHRLLVRGHRVKFVKDTEIYDSKKIDYFTLFIISLISIVFLIVEVKLKRKNNER